MTQCYKVYDVDLSEYNMFQIIDDSCSIPKGQGYGDVGEIPILEGFIPGSEETIIITMMRICELFLYVYINWGQNISYQIEFIAGKL